MGSCPNFLRAPRASREPSPYAVADSAPRERDSEARSTEDAPRPRRTDSAPKRHDLSDAPARYRIEIGKNQGVLPKEIVGAIANECGIDGKQIGQINLFDDYTTVELPGNLPADVMDVLQRVRVRQFALKARVLAPGEFVEDARPPRRAPSTATTRKPVDGPTRKPFDGPKKDFDKPRKAYDGPRSGDAPPRSRPPFESSRKPSGAVRKVSLPPRSKTPR